MSQTVTVGFMIHKFLVSKLNLTIMSNLVFYVTGLFSAIFLLKLAYEWPSFVRRAANIERRVADIHINRIRAAKFNRTTFVVLMLAAVEHTLSIISKVKNVATYYDEGVYGNVLESYCNMTFGFVVEYVHCNYFTLLVYSLINIQATFLWNFTDVMTMCFSMYLTSYFREFNALVNSQKSKKTHSWEQLRYYYSQLVALVQTVDARMCYLILVSVFTNLFFICIQLFHTLNFGYTPSTNYKGQLNVRLNGFDKAIHLIYYAYSFTFLLVRAAVMFFVASNVETSAREPKHALSFVSSAEYNIHVQRLNRQLRYTTTALSGLFFYVTREMILKVFATIVTYELVLFQFKLSVNI